MIFHGTTILSVRKDKEVVVGGDGQVTLGNTVMKGNAKKVRRLYNNKILEYLPVGLPYYQLEERHPNQMYSLGFLNRFPSINAVFPGLILYN